MNKKRIVLLILLIGMIINLGLAGYIQAGKSQIESNSATKCFLGGGCATVQGSYYANTAGLSNPYWGYIGFTLFAIVFAVLLIGSYNTKVSSFLKRHELPIHIFLIVGLTIGTLFSIWLLYVQFYLLSTTCIYCLWVDAIMIGSLILYAIFYDALI